MREILGTVTLWEAKINTEQPLDCCASWAIIGCLHVDANTLVYIPVLAFFVLYLFPPVLFSQNF